jgi:hypothetical protein
VGGGVGGMTRGLVQDVIVRDGQAEAEILNGVYKQVCPAVVLLDPHRVPVFAYMRDSDSCVPRVVMHDPAHSRTFMPCAHYAT